MDWLEIEKCLAENQLEKFGRNPKDEEFYQQKLAQLKSNYGSNYNFLVQVKLQPLKEIIQKEGPTQTLTYEEKAFEIPQVYLTKNDFGYHLREGIHHYLIWSFQNWNDREAIDKFIRAKFKNLNKFVFFVNPEHLQSVKEIFHIHIFIELNN